MTLQIFDQLEQGTPAWYDVRRGIVTASTVGQLITPKTVKVAANDNSRALVAQLVAERITGYTEPTYASLDMEQGHMNEPIARDLYSETFAPVTQVGFMTNTFNGYTIGYSPDGLVGTDGLIEVKSRRQKKHLQTILADEVPLENVAQCQAGLLISGRSWLDFISYCGGMPLYVKRVHPDPTWQKAIVDALTQFEQQAGQMIDAYIKQVKGMLETERVPDFTEIEI
jgi:hypothetical protein